MYPRLLEKPLRLGTSFFLFGPRGTGKTTWLRQRIPDGIYLDLLDAALYTDLLAHSERLRDFIPSHGESWVILD
jgi:predicted AAA+ superfamily ATPase